MMREEILAQIKKNAAESSIKKISDEEVTKIILDTEKSLGRELTGYGKIDKPYEQFYSKEALNRKYENHEKIASRVLRECEKNATKIAYKVGETSITYDELKKNILLYANKLAALGIKKGDFITICALSTPEVIYMFFAANLIGAITRPVDPISSEESIRKEIIKTGSKLLVTCDFNYMKLKGIKTGTNLQKIVALPADYTITSFQTTESKILKLLSQISRKLIRLTSSKSSWITKEMFENIASNNLEYNELLDPYEENAVVSIFSTSGSTGEPRGVCITDSNLILSVEKQMHSNFRVDSEESMYNPMPSCSSYFWQDTLLAIMYGVSTELDPFFSSQTAAKKIFESDASVILLGPIIVEEIIKYINRETDVYFNNRKKHIVSGGDLLSMDVEQDGNNALQQFNPTLKIENALGTSETTGPAFNPNGIIDDERAYSEGSCGIILPGDDYAIFEYDGETQTRNIYAEGFNQGLQYYQVGEICFSTRNKNIFKEYFKDEEATKAVKITHTDGTEWYHTGDLGYMDPAGFQYCSGRKSGLIVRSGHKIWTQKIKKIIQTFSEVKEFEILGVPDEIDKEVPALFIVFNENIPSYKKEQVKSSMVAKIELELDKMHVPLYIWELESLPRNTMLKVKKGELSQIHLSRKEKIQQNKQRTFSLKKILKKG